MNLSRSIAQYFRKGLDRFGPPRRLIVVKGDTLPSKMPFRNLVLARDDGEDWSVGMRCPCGCERAIELLVIHEARPRWDLKVDANGLPSLSPSVWLTTGCKSHFWLKDGKVIWV